MKTEIKLGLIDDEPLALDNLKGLINGIPGYEIAFAVTDPTEGVKLARNKYCDILMTDIEMDRLNGLIISEEMEDLGTPVIICSAYEAYAIPSINISVSGYLLKPVQILDLKHILSKVSQKIQPKNQVTKEKELDFIMIKEPDSFSYLKVELTQILFIEQNKNYSFIHTDKQLFKERSTIESWAQKLPSRQFLRIHQSYIVNFSKVKRIHGKDVELSNGIKLTVSNSYREKLIKSCRL